MECVSINKSDIVIVCLQGWFNIRIYGQILIMLGGELFESPG